MTPSEPDEIRRRLRAAIATRLGPPGDVLDLTRLTGGATKATWAFDAVIGAQRLPLILQLSAPRRLAPDDPAGRLPRVHGEAEGTLLRAVAGAGVPVPGVRLVLDPADGLGAGCVTDRVDGETLGRRVIQDERLAGARARMTAQCGEILARLHRIDASRLPVLAPHGAADQVALYRDIWDSFDHPHPAVELGFRWAAEHAPGGAPTTPVHGDFRTGNFVVGPDGIRAVLDWELAHLGDPMEDLGWLCVKTWRFGGARAVGGFGERAALVEAYERAGGSPVEPRHVQFWEVFGCLKWSVMCMMKGQRGQRTLEALAIGRRTEEPVHDLLELILSEG
jgi:aminoglycoside phosphotransferase (APT) family kinase protein